MFAALLDYLHTDCLPAGLAWPVLVELMVAAERVYLLLLLLFMLLLLLLLMLLVLMLKYGPLRRQFAFQL